MNSQRFTADESREIEDMVAKARGEAANGGGPVGVFRLGPPEPGMLSDDALEEAAGRIRAEVGLAASVDDAEIYVAGRL